MFQIQQKICPDEVPAMIMKILSFFTILLCASLLLTGLVCAAIPTPVDGRITDAVTEDHLSGFHTNNLTAIGAWNDRIWSEGGSVTCRELNGRTICYQSRPVLKSNPPVLKVAQSDVPDNMLALLTALRNGTPTW
jgi:hypothetical protein